MITTWNELNKTIRDLPLGLSYINDVGFIKIIITEEYGGHGGSWKEKGIQLAFFDGTTYKWRNVGDQNFNDSFPACRIFGFLPEHYKHTIARDGNFPMKMDIFTAGKSLDMSDGPKENYLIETIYVPCKIVSK